MEDAVRSVPQFHGLSGSEMHQLLAVLVRCDHPRGEPIVTQGERGDAMYFVVAGEACVVAENGVGVCRIRAGGFFGETSLMHTGTRTATVVAEGSGAGEVGTTTMMLRRSDFKRLLLTMMQGQASSVVVAPNAAMRKQ